MTGHIIRIRGGWKVRILDEHPFLKQVGVTGDGMPIFRSTISQRSTVGSLGMESGSGLPACTRIPSGKTGSRSSKDSERET